MIRPTTHSTLAALLRDRYQTAPRAAESGAPERPRETSRTRSAQQPASDTAALSSAERRMIQDEFPGNRRTTMRLYGPGRPTSVTPQGVGSHLDLKG